MNFRAQQKELPALLDITPLIDVVFLMLIFFMITTSFKTESSLRIELPQTGESGAVSKSEAIVLSLDKNGVLEHKGSIIPNDQLGDYLDALTEGNMERTIVLRADKDVSHGVVVGIIDKTKLAGFSRVAVATEVQNQSRTKSRGK